MGHAFIPPEVAVVDNGGSLGFSSGHDRYLGEFETHITVGPCADEDIVRVREWADARRIKFVHIVLARGTTTSQPMITVEGRGTFADQKRAAEDLSRQLNDAGFPVNRVKIEAAPWNEGVPQDEVGLPSQSRSQYFEHHVKLLLDTNVDLGFVATIAEQHASHLSHNAIRVRNDGRQERFVTQRCFGIGRAAAKRELQSLLVVLKAGELTVLEVEEEFVLYDSNLDIDAGWLAD